MSKQSETLIKNKPLNLYIDASPLAESRITGIPHFTAELIKALDEHPDNGKVFNLILLIAFDKRDKLSRWQFKNTHIKDISLPMRLLNLLWKYRLLPPMDIFFGKGVYLFPNYKNWPLLRSKNLTYIHDLSYLRYPKFTQPKNLKFLQRGVNRWVSRSDIVLTGSDHTKQEIVDLLNVPEEKVIRIYHGVGHSFYYPRSSNEIITAKSKYGIKGKYILHIGSLEPRKNLINLIIAYKALPLKIRQLYGLCLIGGGGWLNGKIIDAINNAQTEGYNIIQPQSYVEDEDLPALISGSTILVHPAVYEGFGLPPLQAMACGVPVLVANNSSMPEVVGEAGVLFNAEKPEDISVKMDKVLSEQDYREQLSVKSLAQSKKFDWSISANELVNCIKKGTETNG